VEKLESAWTFPIGKRFHLDNTQGYAKFFDSAPQRAVNSFPQIPGVDPGPERRTDDPGRLQAIFRRARWDIVNAWPGKYDPPDFSTKGNEVAIELLEIGRRLSIARM